ncbi:5'-AMP-activated protein kinase subunit beta-2 [Sciurus carolinensis]|uniref:5'-AMP-activated protein kinase subunit beta-2 n=1 Tax=Sciurus carolinensis TaxID=30640 RepID=A0AA41T7B9_SCICA|nr:5'-AMP-activated protein kinase subunit beta-2 [Sciurus carolinensis]
MVLGRGSASLEVVGCGSGRGTVEEYQERFPEWGPGDPGAVGVPVGREVGDNGARLPVAGIPFPGPQARRWGRCAPDAAAGVCVPHRCSSSHQVAPQSSCSHGKHHQRKGVWGASQHQGCTCGGRLGHARGKEHKTMVGSINYPGVFSLPDSKLAGVQEFVSWQQDLDDSIKPTQQTQPTVIHWSEGGMEVFISGSFTNWNTKILLIKSHNDFIAILDLPAGREPMQVF